MSKKAIVIGGGLGGISAAVSLRNAGFEVELYEKNGHLGGKLNVLKKDGFSFDLGPSILTFPHIFEELFRGAGRKMEDYLSIVEPGVHWRCFFEDGERIDLLKDLEKIKPSSTCISDKDIEDLRSFLEYSEKLYSSVKSGYFERGTDTFLQAVRTYGVLKSLSGFDIFSTMHEGVRRRIKNEHLCHVIDFFVKYVGSSPYRAPAVLNMIPYGQFEFGLWYVEGGMYNLALALKKLMEDTGVKINLNTEIKELKITDGRISAAVTSGGEKIKGEVFISNMEVIPAYRALTREPEKFIKKYDKFEPACSGLVIHLGTDKEFPSLAHHNFFFSGDPEKHFDDVFGKKILPGDPTIYLVAPKRTDKTVAPEGCDNIKILPHIPYLQDEPFSEEDYMLLRERVLDKLERMGLQGLRGSIITEDIWTPEDIKKNYLSNRGAIYGVVSDKKKNTGFKAPKRSGKYPNLYFVGGSVNPGGGMPMVTLSGQQAAGFIREDNA